MKEWDARSPKMAAYYAVVCKLKGDFEGSSFIMSLRRIMRQPILLRNSAPLRNQFRLAFSFSRFMNQLSEKIILSIRTKLRSIKPLAQFMRLW